jgi:hypothetical protein
MYKIEFVQIGRKMCEMGEGEVGCHEGTNSTAPMFVTVTNTSSREYVQLQISQKSVKKYGKHVQALNTALIYALKVKHDSH